MQPAALCVQPAALRVQVALEGGAVQESTATAARARLRHRIAAVEAKHAALEPKVSRAYMHTYICIRGAERARASPACEWDRVIWHEITPAPLQVSELERSLQEERAAEKAEAAPLSVQACTLAVLTCCIQPRVFSSGVLALLILLCR